VSESVGGFYEERDNTVGRVERKVEKWADEAKKKKSSRR